MSMMIQRDRKTPKFLAHLKTRILIRTLFYYNMQNLRKIFKRKAGTVNMSPTAGRHHDLRYNETKQRMLISLFVNGPIFLANKFFMYPGLTC